MTFRSTIIYTNTFVMKKLTLFFFIIATPLFAQQGPDAHKYCLTEDNLGLGGYDPLAYFENNQAISGKENINAKYEGVTYLFASIDHKKQFLSDPEHYLPQFGGWCSMTLVMGKATTPKYDNFLVEDGKLFLFERTLSVNGKELWAQSPKENEKKAIENYNQYKATGKIK